MAGPNDAARQSAIEKFNDIYKNQPAANKNNGYFKTPNRTYVPPPPPPPPKPQKIRETTYSREQRWGQGFTAGRPLRDNPGFRNPISASQMNLPTSGGGKTIGSLPSRAPILRTGTALDAGLGLTQIILPGVLQQGPNYLNPNNRNGIFQQNQYLDQKRELEQTLARRPPVPPVFRGIQRTVRFLLILSALTSGIHSAQSAHSTSDRPSIRSLYPVNGIPLAREIFAPAINSFQMKRTLTI